MHPWPSGWGIKRGGVGIHHTWESARVTRESQLCVCAIHVFLFFISSKCIFLLPFFFFFFLFSEVIEKRHSLNILQCKYVLWYSCY